LIISNRFPAFYSIISRNSYEVESVLNSGISSN
jgi:hypothetical protein